MAQPPLLRVGLTGGIASGKSTVARFLAALGARVVDADELAREVVEPGGAAYAAVVERFGSEILDAGGAIDRPRLGRRIFTDDAARRDLNAIVHPAVRAEAARRLAVRTEPMIGVFDAALLVETGAYRDFRRLIVTRCSLETQLRRILRRDGLSETEARARIAAQAPLEHKLAVADFVIDTEGSLDDTLEQTREVYAQLRRELAELERPD